MKSILDGIVVTMDRNTTNRQQVSSIVRSLISGNKIRFYKSSNLHSVTVYAVKVHGLSQVVLFRLFIKETIKR